MSKGWTECQDITCDGHIIVAESIVGFRYTYLGSLVETENPGELMIYKSEDEWTETNNAEVDGFQCSVCGVEYHFDVDDYWVEWPGPDDSEITNKAWVKDPARQAYVLRTILRDGSPDDRP